MFCYVTVTSMLCLSAPFCSRECERDRAKTFNTYLSKTTQWNEKRIVRSPVQINYAGGGTLLFLFYQAIFEKNVLKKCWGYVGL